MSRIIKSKRDFGLMSVFELTVIMYKTRQVIMRVSVRRKIKKNTKSDTYDNLHILTYLEKHWFKTF